MFDRSSPTACKNQASIADRVQESGFHRQQCDHIGRMSADIGRMSVDIGRMSVDIGRMSVDFGNPDRLKESLSTVSTVPIGGDPSKRLRGTRRGKKPRKTKAIILSLSEKRGSKHSKNPSRKRLKLRMYGARKSLRVGAPMPNRFSHLPTSNVFVTLVRTKSGLLW
jgi:hypothetical protein